MMGWSLVLVFDERVDVLTMRPCRVGTELLYLYVCSFGQEAEDSTTFSLVLVVSRRCQTTSFFG